MTLTTAVRCLLLACAIALLAGAASADDGPIGYIKTHAGAAFVVSGGKALEAVPGLALRQGDVLRTGDDGRLGLTLLDNTVMSVGPNAELVIDEYLFEPGNDKLGLGVRLLRGTMQFISGVIAKLRPDAVKVRTASGTIGVRGTRFLVTAGN
ncbi:MAG: FecR domain-containing protein [Rhodocyclaceae bacterium]|nr:FecR domain-containing protein [Rhodocyclaceae bacterium]